LHLHAARLKQMVQTLKNSATSHTVRVLIRLKNKRQEFYGKNFIEQINFKKVYLLCKDLLANPCSEMLAGGQSPRPASFLSRLFFAFGIGAGSAGQSSDRFRV
jgi:hypothetical protein